MGTTHQPAPALAQAKDIPTGDRRRNLRVQFALPTHHTDKYNLSWKCHPRTKRVARHNQTVLKEKQFKIGVLEVSIPSAVWDTACTSHVVMVGNPFIQTKHMSTNIFELAN